MSEILEKGFIDKKEKGSGEFQELYLEGIELLQKLSGANWTDYNEHDPGVTIFENIAYTLTNLSYKIDLPIIDILTESKGHTLESGDNGYFIPSDILTTNPVIKDDYRKLFIDGINNIKNVWIKTLSYDHSNEQDKKNNIELKGLYHIFVEIYDYCDNVKERQNEELWIKKRVKELFHSHRNLCENLYQVTILEPFYLDMSLELTLNENVDGELVFAQIYYLINDFLSHDINYESLWELRKKKEDINSIYIGPLLSSGFINDKELQPIKNRISLSEITKIISKIPGVVSIDHFKIQKEKAPYTPFTDAIVVPKKALPRLRIREKHDKLKFKTANVILIPDVRGIKKKFTDIQAEHYGSFKAAASAMNKDDIAIGASLGISSYHSIRKQFPAIYGIGQFGLPKEALPERKAQVNQLKAYLLPFDQLMSNFLSQLTNLYTIYDTNESGIQSYFYQELEDMPDLVDLIKSNSSDKKDALRKWKETLKQLNNTFDTHAILRLNEVADNLLARYAEQFPSYVLKKINTICYGKNFTDISYHKKLLNLKRKLISNYAHLSYNRAKSFDYTFNKVSEASTTINYETPIIIQKISLLLGMHHSGFRKLSDIEKYFKLEPDDLKKEGTIKYTRAQVDAIKRLVESLENHIVFSNQEDANLNEILIQGISADNYEIEATNQFKKTFNLSLKLDPDNFKLARMKVEEDLGIVKQHAISIFKKINEHTEGIHLLEHILLAPPVQGPYFGFSFSLFLSKEREIIFEQLDLLSNNDRNSSVYALNKLEIKYRKKEEQHRYYIEIYKDEKTPLARSRWSFSRLSEVDQYIEAFENLKIPEDTDRLQNLNYHSYFGSHKVNESFFSFKMSFILPLWPVRFQLKSFRKQFNNILYEHAPIHIQYESYWLSLEKMKAFEEDYYKWLSLLSNENLVEERMLVAYKLIQDIKEFNRDNS